MSDIQTFLDFWQKKPGAPEFKIVEAYNKARNDLERRQTELLKMIRPQKTSKGFIPVFLDGADNLSSEFEQAESHLAEITNDIESYLTLADGQPSLIGLNDRLIRAKHSIAEAILEAKSAIIHAVHDTEALSQLEVMDNPKVQSAMDKRDRVQDQLGPVVEDLQSRISRIKGIINKYNRVEI